MKRRETTGEAYKIMSSMKRENWGLQIIPSQCSRAKLQK